MNNIVQSKGDEKNNNFYKNTFSSTKELKYERKIKQIIENFELLWFVYRDQYNISELSMKMSKHILNNQLYELKILKLVTLKIIKIR